MIVSSPFRGENRGLTSWPLLPQQAFAASETRYGVEDHLEQKHLLTSPNLAA